MCFCKDTAYNLVKISKKRNTISFFFMYSNKRKKIFLANKIVWIHFLPSDVNPYGKMRRQKHIVSNSNRKNRSKKYYWFHSVVKIKTIIP